MQMQFFFTQVTQVSSGVLIWTGSLWASLRLASHSLASRGLAYHASGLLLGVLHDDGHLFSDVTHKLFSHALLGVQDRATDVDTVDTHKIYQVHRTARNKLSYSVIHESQVSLVNMDQCVSRQDPHGPLLLPGYLDGYCSVFRFQPLVVSALERRKISKSLEPMATTDTSGLPNTNSPFILRTLQDRGE